MHDKIRHMPLGARTGVSRRRTVFASILMGLLLSFSGLQLWAQNPDGSLRGEVQDSSGARIASANVNVTSAGSSLTRNVSADRNGEFRIEGLVPGQYRVAVTAPGFAPAVTQIAVVVSQVRDLAVTLKPKSSPETVSVLGATSSITAEPLDTATAIHGGAVTARDIQTIPLAHRSFANIAYLVPGTAPVEPSDPTKARITAVAFGGSSGLNVDLSVDGGDNSDDYIGGFLQNFSPDVIQEFAVQTSQEDAETGRTVGGSVVITTRHGTNDWHGTGAFYERASALNARFPIDNPPPSPKQPFSRQNYVATLGGPLQRDRLWFFAGIEAVHEDASISYSPDTVAQFNALSQLAAEGLIIGTGQTGQPVGVAAIPVPNHVTVPLRDYLGNVRFDFSQSDRSQWFLRGSLDNYTTNNDLVQQATLPSTGATSGSKYENVALGNTFIFGPKWLGSLVLGASFLHHTESRNSNLGFALAFPFSSTFRTISGFETFGDNQFATPITGFPVLRNQQKYQFRYDVSHSSGRHAAKFGVSLIHEPVLSGALAGAAETLIQYANNPIFYAANPSQFYFDPQCVNPPADVTCTSTAAADGSFSQSIRRLGVYAQDSFRITSNLTLNYGLRYDTTFGLFEASGRNQLQNPAYLTLQALRIPLANGQPHDYRKQFGPRLGIAYSPGTTESTVLRAGIGIYYNDLAQNGWVNALQAVNAAPGVCTNPAQGTGDNSGCIAGAAAGGSGALIDPRYHTPYALHASAGVQHAFTEKWTVSADWTHQNGVHAYRAYPFSGGQNLFTPLALAPGLGQADVVPNIDLYKTDNRSAYDALTVRVQGNLPRLNVTAHYTLASAKTWGCTVGELFDYVNGVCDPLNAFAAGDYGPSGEDVRHRFVVAGVWRAYAGFELSTMTQVESARPFTLGNGGDRAVINGTKTTLDQFRGTPFAQVDLRVARPFRIADRWSVMPFVEFFNLFNRSNPANNYVADVAGLNVPADQIASGNITGLCGNADCTQLVPITSLNQLRKPAGALGDFFGSGTTVGIPFAAQFGIRLDF